MAENPRFKKLLDEILDLHNRKNTNYARVGDPFYNFRGSEEFGVPAWKGVLVRMSDKWNRIQNLANGVPDLVGESLSDTLQDLAVYSLICKLLLEDVVGQSQPGECCPEHGGGIIMAPPRGPLARNR